ncbi:recombinase family protein [Fangia hongkongensis]|uniref:recombinase family protein n=1 Tax=Fangia hongkongensis TaxID=270495 RepID=UPI00035FD70A|nr:recombinase family protein [Fangia hongkongensis]
MSKHSTGQKIGYARVSSSGQSLDVQIDKLKETGCEKIYQEKISGTDQNRPKLLECLDYVRAGDTLIVTKLDRIARSVLHLKQIADQLEKKKVDLVVLDQKIDTTTSQGKLMFNMLSAFAEFENDLRKERQADGIKKALENGIKFGRPGKVDSHLVIGVKSYINKGVKVSKTLPQFGISRSTYYMIKKGQYDHLLPDDYKQMKSITLTLDLEIAGLNKFVRGVKKVREKVEYILRESYILVKLYKNATDYKITLEYADDEDLQRKIAHIYNECSGAADLYDCCVEIDLYDGAGSSY